MGKTLHLTIEVHNGLIKGLVDTCAFMSIMATTIIRELRFMHLILGNESYKITFCTITRALDRIMNILVKVGNFQCSMVFLIVDTHNYNVFLGLDFLMKIRVVINVEKGIIQVQNGPTMEVELLPLIIINMLQHVSE